jgi:O-6-methylguanine DNA methyltransferase
MNEKTFSYQLLSSAFGMVGVVWKQDQVDTSPMIVRIFLPREGFRLGEQVGECYPGASSGSHPRLSAPRAARAVGTALARNPFPLIIPCHRVVRSDGMLGGFGGGLKMKKALLEMEGVAFDRSGRVQKAHLWS